MANKIDVNKIIKKTKENAAIPAARKNAAADVNMRAEDSSLTA